MKTLAHIVITLIAATSVTACVADEETREPVEVWVWDATGDLEMSLASDAPDHADLLMAASDSAEAAICRCDTSECELTMVEETYGCGVCVMVNCSEGAAGGCVACADVLAAPGPGLDRAW